MYKRHQAALAELGRVALASTNLQMLMQHVCEIVARALDVEYSMVLELLPDSTGLLLRAGTGWREGDIGHSTIAFETGVPDCLTRVDMTPLVVEDWRAETRFIQPALLRDHQIMSTLCVAIPGHDHPFGVLGAGSAAPRVFRDGASLFLQAAAQVLALASERVQVSGNLDWLGAAHSRTVLEERQRLARELHDSVAQSLYGATLHAEATARLLASGDITAAAHYLRELKETAQEALEEMRLLIFDLRPPILDQEGLVPALQARLDSVGEWTNLRTRLIAEGVDRLSADVEQALYRIAQEAVNNARRHASARTITVVLRHEADTMILEIVDDGAGFDVATASAKGGFGLRGMAERVEQLKGRLSLKSTPGVETQVRVEVPL